MSEKREPEQLRKLFIFGLNYETTEEALKSHFEQWGELVDCVVMKKMRKSNKSRGFGYITYKRAHMVDDAQAARPHTVDGREVASKRAVPREESNNPAALVTVNKLYVSGIKDDLTEDDLRDYFGPYGNILSVKIVVDENTGKRRGFAFVEFDDHDPVDKICLQRHNYKGKKLEVKKALSRDEMKKIKMKKEMQSYRRGEWHTSDEFERGGYRSGGYGYSGYAGSYGEEFGDRYVNDYGSSAGRYGNDYGSSSASRYENDYISSNASRYGNDYESSSADRYGIDYESSSADRYGIDHRSANRYENNYESGSAGRYGNDYESSSAGRYGNDYGSSSGDRYEDDYRSGSASRYGNDFGSSSIDGWNDDYVEHYYNGGGRKAGWGSNFSSGDGGGPIRVNIDYSQHSRSPYSGGRRSSRYGG